MHRADPFAREFIGENGTIGGNLRTNHRGGKTCPGFNLMSVLSTATRHSRGACALIDDGFNKRDPPQRTPLQDVLRR